jgi:hypothetical protein
MAPHRSGCHSAVTVRPRKTMRTLIYKRTHSGDPDPKTGEFGCNDCMGSVRGWEFDAVIGIGGIGSEPKRHGIACKLTWIGIGKHETTHDPNRLFVSSRCPLVTFDHFLYYGQQGPSLKDIAPELARHMYDNNVRTLMNSMSSVEKREVERILYLARDAPPSRHLSGRDVRHTSGKCRPKSRDVRTTDDCRPPKRNRARCNRKPK